MQWGEAFQISLGMAKGSLKAQVKPLGVVGEAANQRSASDHPLCAFSTSLHTGFQNNADNKVILILVFTRLRFEPSTVWPWRAT